MNYCVRNMGFRETIRELKQRRFFSDTRQPEVSIFAFNMP